MNQGQGHDSRRFNYNDYQFVYQDTTPSVKVGQAPAPAAVNVDQAAGARIFVNRVYNWMFCGLMLTAIVAWGIIQVARPSELVKLSIPLGIVELVLVVALSFAIRHISSEVAGAMFIGYSILNGLTLSPILLYYTQTSIFLAFGSCALMFAATSVFGYVTKTRLDSVGAFCFMALIGLVIASLANIFMKSEMLDYILGYVGVVVFVGLTAWDTQKLRTFGEAAGEDAQTENMRKASIIFALSLYLHFINLFISLLRIFGDER